MNKAKIVYEGHWIRRALPANVRDPDTALFSTALEGWSREVKIETLENVRINNELFIKQRWKLSIMMQSFGDTWQDGVFNRPLYQLKSFVKNSLRSTRKIKRALWCFDQFSTGGYYHWITEICPRLWVASQHVPSDVPLLVPEYFLSKWKFASSFFEPFRRPLIFFKQREVVDVDELIFIGQTGGPFNFQPEPISASTEALQAAYAGSIDLIKPVKVYISRQNSGKRMILNEDAVFALVQKFGFTVIRTEDLSIGEQVKLFSGATDLVSIHGAGISNMVFMPRGARIVEIRHRDNNPMLTCFFALAHTFGHQYYYTFGDDKGDSLPTELRPEDKSIHADLTMLEDVLQKLK